MLRKNVGGPTNWLKFGISTVVGYIIISFIDERIGWAKSNSTNNQIHTHVCTGPSDHSDCVEPSLNDTIPGFIPRDFWPWGPLTSEKHPSIKPASH